MADAIKKHTQEVPEGTSTQTYVVVHNLGTKAVHCSCRKKDGSVRKVASLAQDENIVVLTSHEGYFSEGDTAIVIG